MDLNALSSSTRQQQENQVNSNENLLFAQSFENHIKSFDIVSKLSKLPMKRKPHPVHRCHLGVESKPPCAAPENTDNAIVPPCLKGSNDIDGTSVVEIDKLSLVGDEGIKQVRILV